MGARHRAALAGSGGDPALGDAARTFAANHCGEDALVAYFENYVHTPARPPMAARSTDDSKKGDLR
jgi:hypothetical protein